MNACPVTPSIGRPRHAADMAERMMLSGVHSRRRCVRSTEISTDWMSFAVGSRPASAASKRGVSGASWFSRMAGGLDIGGLLVFSVRRFDFASDHAEPIGVGHGFVVQKLGNLSEPT